MPILSKSNKFKMVLETAGESFEGKGTTALEALENIPRDYTHIKYKGLFRLTQGKKYSELFLYTRPLKRVFANKLTRVYIARNLESLLDEARPTDVRPYQPVEE